MSDEKKYYSNLPGTKVFGMDNKLKMIKTSSPVTKSIMKIPMPKLDYESFNKGGAVMKKKKTKMMAKGGKVKKTKMMAKGGKVKGTKMYSKGGKVSKGR